MRKSYRQDVSLFRWPFNEDRPNLPVIGSPIMYYGREICHFVLRQFRLQIAVLRDIMRKGRKGVRTTPAVRQ